MKKNNTLTNCFGIFTMSLLASAVSAQTIDNDLNEAVPGYLSVDLNAGGEAEIASFTAIGNPSFTLFRNTNFLFFYSSQVDIGDAGEAFPLATASEAGSTLVNSGPGDDEVVSSGSFTGSTGGRVDWSVSSVIPDGAGTMTNTYSFSASSGTLGEIRFYQYIDQDVLSSSDDIFFTRGDASAGTLELFTIDDDEAIGLSQSGALDATSGLSNAIFSGWAACTFPSITEAISDGTQQVSLAGEICPELLNNAIDHPIAGPAFGPLDIVSALAWDVDPGASNATIITTMNISESKVAPTTAATCQGFPVTVNLAMGQSPTSGNDVILGTEGADVIRALGGNDIICALGGNDRINAGAGDDIVDAGPGNDRVFGIGGDDALFGGQGGDQMFGGPGFDVLVGQRGNDRLSGGSGDDLMYGDNGNDGVFGQGGDDTLFGGNGNDLITGNAGSDILNGGRGSDRLAGDANVRQAGNDTLDGGPGADELLGRAGDDFCIADSADTLDDCS